LPALGSRPRRLSPAEGVLEKGSGTHELRAAVRAVAVESQAMPKPSRSIQDLVTASIPAEDRQIMAMLVDGAAPEQVAPRLQVPARGSSCAAGESSGSSLVHRRALGRACGSG
jgi:hypothetical protein